MNNRLFLSLPIAIGATLACSIGSSPAFARKYTVSESTGHSLCGGNLQSSARTGWSGCSILGKNGKFYDVGCKNGSGKCTIVVVIKPTGGKTGKGPVRTGGVKNVSQDGHHKPIHHPVRVESGVHPVVNTSTSHHH
jgi:hypothetical protein